MTLVGLSHLVKAQPDMIRTNMIDMCFMWFIFDVFSILAQININVKHYFEILSKKILLDIEQIMCFNSNYETSNSKNQDKTANCKTWWSKTSRRKIKRGFKLCVPIRKRINSWVAIV